MANLTQIIYLTREDYEALLADTHDPKQYTKNGKTIYYDENALYITPETVTMEDLSGTLPVSKGGTGASSFTSGQLLVGNGTNAISTKAISGSIINDVNTIPTTQAVYNNTLLKSGGTMTGVFTAKGSQYDDSITSSTSHAINMNNSNIIGLNAIYTADASDGAAEGINFYRDATHFDTLWMSGGDLLFVPNRTLGTNTTKTDSQKVGRFTTNPTTGQVVITDGTTGGMQSSGYTIAKSVPSNAVFTDTTYSAGTGLSLSGTTFSNSGVLSVAGSTGAITADTLRTSLGLSNAMHFLGVTTTNISTGTANTTATVTIESSNVTAAGGDVVLYGSQEYVWGNSKWNLLGDESSYKVKQTAKSDPTASTTTSTTFIDTISQDANGVITATKKTLPSYVATSAGVTAVTWDSTNKKLTRTINGTAADVVTIGTIKTALELAKSDVGLGSVDNTADADKTVKYANMLTGFSSRSTSMGWGNQTGSVITCLSSSGGGGWGFRDNNPASGQMSMTIDGTIYIKEGAVNIGDAVKSFSVSGKTVTYTTLWGNTGTFTTQDTDNDTKNTAGSTNSTSKLFLIGATTQAANPTTNSYQYTYTNNGLLSALELGLNLNGTEKAHLEWNDTDQSIDFVFN